MRIEQIKSLHLLIREFSQEKKSKLKIICDWDDVIQANLPFLAWKLKGEENTFENFYKNFWQNEYKNHEEFRRKYNVDKEEVKTKYEKLKKDPDFYKKSPFLSPTKELLNSIEDELISELIFLTASDKNIFPNGDQRKLEVFKDTFGHFSRAQLIFVPYISGFTPVKGEWIKDNHPDFDIFIDDRPDIVSEVSKLFLPNKIYALPDYGYNKIEGENICHLVTNISFLKKEGFIQKETSKEKIKTQQLLQEYLSKKYPSQKDKQKVKGIIIDGSISQEEREIYKTISGGELNLSAYPNLEKVVISGHYLKSPLTKLEVTDCLNLKELEFYNNLLTELECSKNIKLEKLTFFSNNFLKQDLSMFSHLVNLKTLWFGNYDKERIKNDIYNRFYGSLKPLQNLTRLEWLSISNTDVDSGLEFLPDSLKKFKCYDDSCERPEAKATDLYERELRGVGGSIQAWKEFYNSPAQKWLDENYSESKGKTYLDISEKEVAGVLRLKEFSNLEVFKCSNNGLTNLDLSDCKSLRTLTCNNNEFRNLNFLESVVNLRYLNIDNCPLEGSLRPLQNLNKLEELSITNTKLSEGLEYLPNSCKKIFCNSDYQHKSIELVKELEQSNCSEGEGNHKYYIPAKWKEDKQNKMISNIITLERLFVIRGNLKSFVSKWGIKESQQASELSKLQNPKEINAYWYIGEGGQWIARGTAVTGGILAATVNPILGGILAAASPVLEVSASQIKERIYEAKQSQWNSFLEDADNFLDNYHELLGILAPIEIKELLAGKVSVAVKELNEKAEEFLRLYDEDKNQEIILDELVQKRDKLAQDLNEGEEKSKSWGLVKAIKDLEKAIIDYRKLSYGANKESEETEADQAKNQLTSLDIKLVQRKEERNRLEKNKNQLAIKLRKGEINYQQIKKELAKKQSDLLLLTDTDEELELLNKEINNLKKELRSEKQKKEETKKRLIQAQIALFKQQIRSINLGNKISHWWEATREYMEDWVTNAQIKMTTPVYLWEACCNQENKQKGKDKINLDTEQLENELETATQIEILPKNN
ncbi:MAG: hypothetical protein MRERV_12c030 [Mycoplasmataceae bacterium RV_VA103A]|nr:MAG: hypothetical protein MRERV_12c030 [Mycoplasmataceae bacterium RV_VA103A]